MDDFWDWYDFFAELLVVLIVWGLPIILVLLVASLFVH
jgi:hypothetical protein